jgi:dihydrofolate reductase
MRPVVLVMHVTLDGYVAGPGGDLDWQRPQMDAELAAFVYDTLTGLSMLLTGRVAYEQRTAHWPRSWDLLVPLMDKIPTVVFSRTRAPVDPGQNARLATAGPAVEIDRLKRQRGGPIGVPGGAAFARCLLHEGLLERLELTVHPVVLGSGTPLFARPLALQLLDSRPFTSGVVHMTYRPV